MTLVAPPAYPLVALCAAVGIDRDELARGEAAGHISGTYHTTGRRLAELTTTLVDNAIAVYGDALRFAVAVGDFVELELSGGSYDAGRLADLLQRVKAGDRYKIELRLNTARLAELCAAKEANADAVNITVVVFQQTLISILERSLHEVEKVLWPEPDRRAVVLVGDQDANVQGPALTIIGGGNAIDATPIGLDPDLVLKSRKRRPERIPWDSSIRTALTPWHLHRTNGSADADLLAAVDGRFCDLFILFTCNAATRDQHGAATAAYRTDKLSVAVPLGARGPLFLDLTLAHSALALLEWCYGADDYPGLNWTAERLPFLQLHFARVLGNTDGSMRRQTLINGLVDCKEAVKWQWRAFVDGRVETYLDSVREVEDAVIAAVDSYDERSRALFEDVNKAMLAAVATVVGAFIASTLRGTFNEMLFVIGMYVYGAYVVTFPGLLGLSGALQRAGDIKALFESRLTRLAGLLSQDRVDDIVGARPDISRRRLLIWIALFASLYVALGILALVATRVVPAIV